MASSPAKLHLKKGAVSRSSQSLVKRRPTREWFSLKKYHPDGTLGPKIVGSWMLILFILFIPHKISKNGKSIRPTPDECFLCLRGNHSSVPNASSLIHVFSTFDGYVLGSTKHIPIVLNNDGSPLPHRFRFVCNLVGSWSIIVTRC